MKKIFASVLCLMLLLVAACSGGQATEAPTSAPTEDTASQATTEEPTAVPTEEATEEPTAVPTEEATADAATEEPTAVMTEEATQEAVSESTEAAGSPTEAASSVNADLPAWMTMTLKNLRTDEEFTIADLLGKTIYVQIFDTLTPDNKTHITAVKEAMTQLDSENYIFLLMEGSISPLPAARLLRFLDDGGEYAGIGTLMPAQMRPLLAKDLGNQAISISLVPHFAIRVDGTWTDLRTRPESADDIATWLQAVDKGDE